MTQRIAQVNKINKINSKQISPLVYVSFAVHFLFRLMNISVIISMLLYFFFATFEVT